MRWAAGRAPPQERARDRPGPAGATGWRHHCRCPDPLALPFSFRLQALGNPMFALFFLFPECERLVKWAAHVWPTANFKRVRGVPTW